MAESSASYLASLSSLPNASRSRLISTSLSPLSRRSSALFLTPSRFLRFSAVRASSSSESPFPTDDDPYGFYPWDSLSSGDGSSKIEWVAEDKVTLFTADGLVQIGGSLIPRRRQVLESRGKFVNLHGRVVDNIKDRGVYGSANRRQGRPGVSQRYKRFQEKNYMDPKQSLCLGALFDIAATNGLDLGRKLCIIGFCRSIEMPSDVVEDTVLEHGGEIVAAEKASEGGLQEKLKMRIAVPLLWGVPPASETLHLAVRSGGGIVDKVYWRWDFL